MEKAENSMLALVVNWARTPPLAREDDPWPTEASRSRTSTRSTPARRSSRATDSPMTPPPTTATSTVSGTTPGPSGDRGQPRLGPGGQVLGQADDRHDQAPDGGGGDQAGRHPGPVGQGGHRPEPEHEQDAEELVQVDQAEGVAGPEEHPEDELDHPDDADAHLEAGDGAHAAPFVGTDGQASQPGRTRPDS